MNEKHMIVNVTVLLLFLSTFSCQKSYQTERKTENANQLFQFREIGSKELLATKFPQQWKIHPYENSLPITESDSINEFNLNKLDYFDRVKGRLLKNRKYISFLSEKQIHIDSIFVIDSISNKKHSFVYLKIFKTIEDLNYDFPATIKQIDVLVFYNSQFLRKLNIYTKKNYPFAVDLKLGYFNKNGNLFTKEFKMDEERTIFTKEEQCSLSNNGEITRQSSTVVKLNKIDIIKQNTLKESNLIGSYRIYAPAISNSNGERISLGYFITIKSLTKAVLSIDSRYSEDYGCEGEYNLENSGNIIHAKGKCDQDGLDDFYLKYENGKCLIKSRRFINHDWQELIKE